MAIKERIRVGGRSARIQTAVHEAVRALLSEHQDRSDVTVPAIASRAGVTPSTIYRRWGDLAELLADVAAERLRPVANPDDTGSQQGDLRAYVEQYAEEFSSPAGRAMLRDIFAASVEGDYSGQCCGYTYDHLTAIADRAKLRGEDPIVVQDVVDHVIAPIMYRILFGPVELTEAYWRRLLDRALDEGARSEAKEP